MSDHEHLHHDRGPSSQGSFWTSQTIIVWLAFLLIAGFLLVSEHRAHFLGAQIAGRLLFLPIEAGVLLVFARLAFGVPVEGSWLLLTAIIVLGAVMGGALSLLIASRARSFEAVSGLINFATLPMWIFSGVFFASSNFPDVMQPFIQALPLTALNDALRAVMLAGAGAGEIAHEIAIMAAWAIASFAVALRIFRWQ